MRIIGKHYTEAVPRMGTLEVTYEVVPDEPDVGVIGEVEILVAVALGVNVLGELTDCELDAIHAAIGYEEAAAA
jgi:hypothetical protein